MMVVTEQTPKLDTLKFMPGKKVSKIGPVEFSINDKKINVLLANKILSLEGAVMVFFGEDFITVKKKKNLNWKDLKHNVISKINDYYSKGNETVIKKNIYASISKSELDQSDETINKINKILDEKIRPAVARDGGDFKFKSFKDGIVTVEPKGSCSGCPSSIMTFKQGVQNLLCHYIPKLKSVEAI